MRDITRFAVVTVAGCAVVGATARGAQPQRTSVTALASSDTACGNGSHRPAPYDTTKVPTVGTKQKWSRKDCLNQT